jgi:hypothetical protein
VKRKRRTKRRKKKRRKKGRRRKRRRKRRKIRKRSKESKPLTNSDEISRKKEEEEQRKASKKEEERKKREVEEQKLKEEEEARKRVRIFVENSWNFLGRSKNSIRIGEVEGIGRKTSKRRSRTQKDGGRTGSNESGKKEKTTSISERIFEQKRFKNKFFIHQIGHVRRNWNIRFFVLDFEQKQVRYYADNTLEKLKGSFSLEGITVQMEAEARAREL